MNYRLINFPHFVDRTVYEKAIQAMLDRIAQLPETVAVYNIGSVSNPGISDIDMILVTRHESLLSQNFLLSLTPEERYLFTHNLYAISEKHFSESEYFTFFHNYNLAFGSELRSFHKPTAEHTAILQKQVALEFLIKMFIHLAVQEKYKVLRIRDLLLHVKALQYDFDFLGIQEGQVVTLVHTLIEWRKQWFATPPSKQEILQWWKEFYREFEIFLSHVLEENVFYIPEKRDFRLSRNIILRPTGQKPGFSHHGFLLSNSFSFIGKRFFRMQNRLNRFEFIIPGTSSPWPDILKNKFMFEQDLKDYQKKYLPRFLPLTSSLHLG